MMFFISLGILALLIAYFIFYVIKLKKRIKILLREITVKLAYNESEREKLIEKTKKLSMEKQQVDLLLKTMLPDSTINELKSLGKSKPRQFKKVSIMFADFKGFTKTAESLKPKELVSCLDEFFTKYDDIVKQYNVEKIKTIGDAYMCAAGIPIRNDSNPIDITLAALAIQRVTKKINKPGWKLKIGIHTGEVVTGVVGLHRYSYDIWGDSVNIASRIESASDTSKVNISESTYEHIKEFFECTYRGKIRAKNKGYVDMFFVHGIKKELSINQEGIYPNKLFKRYLNLHIYSNIKYKKAEKHIIQMLENMLPDNLFYHDIQHTKDVCAAVERYGLMEGIEGDNLFLLKTAALFHDAGFTERYKDNEDIGASLAMKTLPEFGYTEKQIQIIKDLISATKITYKPLNHLEEIIKDADLDYLGGDEFLTISNRLKREFKERDIISGEKEWDELQVNFLEKHRYYTKSAINLREKKKLKHLEEIKKRLKTPGYYNQ